MVKSTQASDLAIRGSNSGPGSNLSLENQINNNNKNNENNNSK